jgi:mRNA interferase RelE/StbE
MNYRIEFTAGAENQYIKIFNTNKKLSSRIQNSLQNISSNPYSGKRLVGELKGKFSYRVGNYRIIYRIDNEIITVYILKIEKRGSVYRK